jgi:hypothetical protein
MNILFMASENKKEIITFVLIYTHQTIKKKKKKKNYQWHKKKVKHRMRFMMDLL